MNYFCHYSKMNDLSTYGRQRNWNSYRRIWGPLLPAAKDARILDIGCGAGLLMEWLVKGAGYAHVFGIDVDPGQIAFAKSLGLNSELVNDASFWINQQAPFDVILMTDVLEHLSKETSCLLLASAFRALKPEGRFIVRVPNANSTFASRYRYIDSTHRRSYAESSLAYDLESAGFEVLRIYPDDLWWTGSIQGGIRLLLKLAVRAWRRLEALAELGNPGVRLPLSLNLIAVCHKSNERCANIDSFHGQKES